MRNIYITDSDFSSTLLTWYRQNKRNLPWRESNNPYIIWLSEIILQQTRVDQGLPYFNAFVEKYPHIEALAFAPQDEVFKLWQGLGYYNRAKNLHIAAKDIVENHGGKFPISYEDVIALKGVGEYTAAAIMSFAYNAPYAAVDGNVYRVLSRIFGLEEYIGSALGKKVFQEMATELLDKQRAGLFNQAIMDFGSLQCVPKSPDCSLCPFSEKCFAYNTDMIDVFPRKKGKVAVRDRYFNYIDIRVDNHLFLKKRELKDIWQGLYEFPLIETEKEISFEELVKNGAYIQMLGGAQEVEVARKYTIKHLLSHQRIYATFYQLNVDSCNLLLHQKINISEIEKYAVSRMTHKYLEDYDQHSS